MSDFDIKALFPTPFMRVPGLLNQPLVDACIDHILSQDQQRNAKSDLLRHTDIVNPGSSGPYQQVNERALPFLSQFGELLFGEALKWSVKEIWTNVLEPGGHQALHTHANSFISGVVYLTTCHPSARTVFHRAIGGQQFIFSNENAKAEMGPFNGTKWVSPEPQPGDLVLFPSYMLHEVPVNQGGRRITIALNAIPDRLDTWGYTVEFSSHRSA